MRKKGVSPVIATVLLIGMVIALSMIVFLWMQAFVKETITKFDGQNVEIVCDLVQFEASYSGGQLLISNVGNVPIYNFEIRESGAGGYGNKDVKDMGDWPKYGLNPGDAFSKQVSLIGELTLTPILIGNSDKGKKVFYCDIDKTGYTL